MRAALLTALVAAAAASAAVVMTRPGDARATGTATLHVTGLDIGKGEKAVIRLHNTTSSSYLVHYTVFAHDTLNGNPVALSALGAGDGARLFGGDTLELDLGPIVTAYRAEQEAGEWDAPLRFVAFGSDGLSGERFGPETIVAEALQTRGKATYRADVTWTD
jgi:hypothetical protein